jgi:hypothetical protein
MNQRLNRHPNESWIQNLWPLVTPTLKVPQEAQHPNLQEDLLTRLREGFKSKPNEPEHNKLN